MILGREVDVGGNMVSKRLLDPLSEILHLDFDICSLSAGGELENTLHHVGPTCHPNKTVKMKSASSLVLNCSRVRRDGAKQPARLARVRVENISAANNEQAT